MLHHFHCTIVSLQVSVLFENKAYIQYTNLNNMHVLYIHACDCICAHSGMSLNVSPPGLRQVLLLFYTSTIFWFV